LAILVYWPSSNVWTLAQQHYVHRLPDRQDAAGVARAINAPPRPVVDPPEDRR
jgi:membrane protein insertase Oxa1/YidC/SpoIIIJ